MSPMDHILALINAGESETVEFRREMEEPEFPQNPLQTLSQSQWEERLFVQEA